MLENLGNKGGVGAREQGMLENLGNKGAREVGAGELKSKAAEGVGAEEAREVELKSKAAKKNKRAEFF